MKNAIDIVPFESEFPSAFADRVGVYYTSMVTKIHKKENGQFFTPKEIANFMGAMAGQSTNNDEITILDPGCGTAILTCSLIEQLISKNANIKNIALTVYEIDNEILSYTEKVLIYLKTWLSTRKINFIFKIITQDFVLQNAEVLNDELTSNLFDKIKTEKFDFIILNPPYFKLSKEDKRTKAAEKVVSGQPNIYAFFMAIAIKLLAIDGQFISITPRSFASGNYFKAFRLFFFSNLEVQQIHLFVSRKDTFTRDNVLQETLIIKGQNSNIISEQQKVIVSSSQGLKDLRSPKIRYFNKEELIDFNSKEKILHLPTSDSEEEIINLFKSWNFKLKDHNIQISTGPVVAFRAKEYIREIYENGTVFLTPLYWLHNILKMKIEWPNPKPNKGQFIKIEQQSLPLLIPNKNYILLRRFSAKDDKSRLIAAPYFSELNKTQYIGVENKVNYIYRPKGELLKEEVIGLSALFNSKLFDTYFRTFNGNVNVSATELREMPLPSLEFIKEIGLKILNSNDYSQENINEVVSKFFEMSDILLK